MVSLPLGERFMVEKSINGPWTDVVIDTKTYTVFRDGFPVTEGHILFVPKEETMECLMACYKAAYAWGYGWVKENYCDGYNIGQNIGESAGQTVMWPHVHLIPRRTGDMADPRGGVHHVIPKMGNYKQHEFDWDNLSNGQTA